MWVARDADGMLYAFPDKPHKAGLEWDSDSFGFPLPKDLFPEVKWTDEKPSKLKLIKY